MQLKNAIVKPAPTIASKGVVYRSSVTISNETDSANAIKASRCINAGRVLMAGVLIGGCCGRAFFNVWKN